MTRLEELRQLRHRIDMEIVAEAMLRGLSPVESIASGQVIVDIEEVDPRVIRDWARAQGYELGGRGALPHSVRNAFQLAHRRGAGSATPPAEPAPSLLAQAATS